jgi:hypothetical protein
MRTIKLLMLMVGMGLPMSGIADARARPQVKANLPLKSPDNTCVSASFERQRGKTVFTLGGKCPNITALVCTFRSVLSAWACETPRLNSIGQTWLAPFPAEPSSVYYFGACKPGNRKCQNTLHWLYGHIIGQPKSLDPQQMRPVEPCDGPNCVPPPPPPPPPPAPERG